MADLPKLSAEWGGEVGADLEVQHYLKLLAAG